MTDTRKQRQKRHLCADMYALCVSGTVNTQGFVWKFFYVLYTNFPSFIHSLYTANCPKAPPPPPPTLPSLLKGPPPPNLYIAKSPKGPPPTPTTTKGTTYTFSFLHWFIHSTPPTLLKAPPTKGTMYKFSFCHSFLQSFTLHCRLS